MPLDDILNVYQFTEYQLWRRLIVGSDAKKKNITEKQN